MTNRRGIIKRITEKKKERKKGLVFSPITNFSDWILEYVGGGGGGGGVMDTHPLISEITHVPLASRIQKERKRKEKVCGFYLTITFENTNCMDGGDPDAGICVLTILCRRERVEQLNSFEMHIYSVHVHVHGHPFLCVSFCLSLLSFPIFLFSGELGFGGQDGMCDPRV